MCTGGVAYTTTLGAIQVWPNVVLDKDLLVTFELQVGAPRAVEGLAPLDLFRLLAGAASSHIPHAAEVLSQDTDTWEDEDVGGLDDDGEGVHSIRVNDDGATATPGTELFHQLQSEVQRFAERNSPRESPSRLSRCPVC